MTLGEKVIRYRAIHKMSQRAFAAKAGLSLQSVRNVEEGTHKATPMTEEKIKIVLEME